MNNTIVGPIYNKFGRESNWGRSPSGASVMQVLARYPRCDLWPTGDIDGVRQSQKIVKGSSLDPYRGSASEMAPKSRDYWGQRGMHACIPRIVNPCNLPPFKVNGLCPLWAPECRKPRVNIFFRSSWDTNVEFECLLAHNFKENSC